MLIVLMSARGNASTGVNFIPIENIYSTYSTWVLSLSTDLAPYYDSLNVLNTTIVNFRSKFNSELDRAAGRWISSNETATDVRDDLNSFRRSVNEYIRASSERNVVAFGNLRDRLDMLRNVFTVNESRQKRSLLPWAGDLLHSLFGTATDSDMNVLRDHLGRLAQNQDDIVHVVENSLTIVNKTNANVVANRKAINLLISAANRFNQRLIVLQENEVTFSKLVKIKTVLQTQVHTVLGKMTHALGRASTLIARIAYDLNRALRGELTMSLVAPSDLREILTHIATRLPTTLTLKRFDGNNIVWYYKHLKVNVLTDRNRVHVVTAIPLIHTDSMYTLYRVIASPIPVPSSNQSTELMIEGTHFAVSASQEYYAILDEDELAKCTDIGLGFCPFHRAAMSLTLTTSCVASLYNEIPALISKTCKIKVTDHQTYPLVTHLTKGKWMITTNKQMIMKEICNNVLTDVLTIEPPIQIISLKSGCIAHSPLTKLPPYFYKSSEDTEHAENFNKINIGKDYLKIWDKKNSNYSFTYNYQLTHDAPQALLPEILSELDSAQVDHLKNQLQHISRNRITIESNSVYKIMSLLLGSLFTIAIIGLVILVVIRKVKMQKKDKKNKTRNNDPLVKFSDLLFNETERDNVNLPNAALTTRDALVRSIPSPVEMLERRITASLRDVSDIV